MFIWAGVRSKIAVCIIFCDLFQGSANPYLEYSTNRLSLLLIELLDSNAFHPRWIFSKSDENVEAKLDTYFRTEVVVVSKMGSVTLGCQCVIVVFRSAFVSYGIGSGFHVTMHCLIRRSSLVIRTEALLAHVEVSAIAFQRYSQW